MCASQCKYPYYVTAPPILLLPEPGKTVQVQSLEQNAQIRNLQEVN